MSHIDSPNEFLAALADELGQEFTAVSRFKRFVTSPTVVGAHAEARVRAFIAKTVAPLRVSTGAVISPELCKEPKRVPQLDCMIWYPRETPAIFDQDGFALVPHGSCSGIIEIKRTADSKSCDLMAAQLEKRHQKCFDHAGPMKQKPLVIGVFCLSGDGKPPCAINNEWTSVVLINHKESENTYSVNREGVIAFVNFMIQVRNVTLFRTVSNVPAMVPEALPKPKN